MGRKCCCKKDQVNPNCEPVNCPLCSCVGTEENPIPIEIKYKDFLTAKYKLSGFENIDFSDSIAGSGGNAVFVGGSEDDVFYYSHYAIPFIGTLYQQYGLAVTGFEPLNGLEFEFDLVNDPNYGCIYQPKTDCLQLIGPVVISEVFNYTFKGNVYAYIAPVYPAWTYFCSSDYFTTHRGCWYGSGKSWSGTIGYTATYDLYVKLNSHRAINNTYIRSRPKDCNLLEECDDPLNCQECRSTPNFRTINNAIELHLVLKSCTPTLSGDEKNTGSFVKHKSTGSLSYYSDYSIVTDCPDIVVPGPDCFGVGCETKYITQYLEGCNQPFTYGYSWGYHRINTDDPNQFYLNAGRIGLSDKVVKYFNYTGNSGINNWLVGSYYENHKNFSFLKQIPFIQPVCFEESIAEINSICCPAIDNKCVDSVIKIPINICPSENICYKYNDATQELKDTYKVYGGSQSYPNRLEFEKCENDESGTTDWSSVLRCSDFKNVNKIYSCSSTGTGKFLGNNLFCSYGDILPYFMRQNCNDSLNFIEPGTHGFTMNEDIYFANLIRMATFAIDDNYYWYANWANKFWYNKYSEDCSTIKLKTKYHKSRKCVSFGTEPVL